MAFLTKNNILENKSNKKFQYKSVLGKIIIALILIFLIILMFPKSETYVFDYKVGTIWTSNDLIAPFSFPIFKDKEQYEKEIDEVKAKVLKVFIYDEKKFYNIQDSLNYILSVLKSINKQKDVPEISLRYSFLQSDETIKFISKISNLDYIENKLNELIKEIYYTGILDIQKSRITENKIAVRKQVFEEIVPIDKYYDVQTATKYAENFLNEKFDSQNLRTLLYEILIYLIQPNIYFNQEETEKLITAAIETVPKTVGYVQQNEKIISKHERVTPETKLKLDSLKKIQVEKGYEESSLYKIVGNAIHTGLILFLFGVYLFLFRKKVFYDNKKLVLISLIILLPIFFSYLSLRIDIKVPLQYLIFLPASAMLLTIIFDSRIAFFASVVMAFLVAAVRGNDYELALVMLVAGSLAAYTVRNIKQRTQIFRSMIFIFAGFALSIIAFGLERSEILGDLLKNIGLALTNSIISPILTYGLLIFFEKAFKVTTDLTLMELTDPNHPLLKMLREKTPGTYHHSMVLGNLAESAADAIGANPILAKVGAYYHDIGKTTKPEYFIENEFQKKNKHQRLTPRMSARIIIAHVKDGIELAREYGLPEEVIAFIPEHHGTTRLSYFFDKALRQAVARKTKNGVNEADYRYPGPKPQTKETAIVMLADNVEAFTRSLQNLTQPRLESAVDERIKMRFIEGQLDECNLTLSDLSKIKEAFINILIGTYHQRIEYPREKVETKNVEEKLVSEKENKITEQAMNQSPEEKPNTYTDGATEENT